MISGTRVVLGKATSRADMSGLRLIRGGTEVVGRIPPRPERTGFKFTSCEGRRLDPIAESNGERSSKG